jgi:hypothetical protein
MNSRAASLSAADGPWRLGDALSLLTLNTVGLVLVLAGWYVAAGRLLFHDQVAGANVAVAGIIVAGAGNGVWLLTGRRALGLRRRVIAGTIERQYRSRPRLLTQQTTTFVAARGMTHYHRQDCVFAAARPVVARRRDTHEAEGRTPCEVCRP